MKIYCIRKVDDNKIYSVELKKSDEAKRSSRIFVGETK